MRKTFFKKLHEQMRTNSHIWVVTGDLGYGGFDLIQKDFPHRYINVGASEQSMMGIGIGLALEGKIPFVYSISTFLLYRPYETIRNYINHEKIPVKLIGSGRGRDYAHDGISHWVDDDRNVVKQFTNITSLWPEQKNEIPMILEEIITTKKPFYLNLQRS